MPFPNPFPSPFPKNLQAFNPLRAGGSNSDLRATGSNSMLRAGQPFTGTPGNAGQLSGFNQAGNIHSAFRPPILPNQNIQADTNQAIANIDQASSPDWLRKLYAPQAATGVARSAATEGMIAPHLAQANIQRTMTQNLMPYQQNLENQQFLTGFEGQRAGDTLSQANNLFGSGEMQDNLRMGQLQNYWGLLSGLLGGMF